MSPALAGGFLTTAPPGKSLVSVLNVKSEFCLPADLKLRSDQQPLGSSNPSSCSSSFTRSAASGFSSVGRGRNDSKLTLLIVKGYY